MGPIFIYLFIVELEKILGESCFGNSKANDGNNKQKHLQAPTHYVGVAYSGKSPFRLRDDR
jgi:hypothetical protein